MSRKRNKKKKQTSLIDSDEKETLTGCRAKCWESELPISVDEKCPHVADHETPKIIIPYEIWHQIMALTKELDTEWVGYLGGSLLESGDWKVVDIKIPKQEVTGSSFKSLDTIPAEGVVHSHVNMGCTFSSVDDDYINENHDFSIVVNQRESNKAVVRIKLPCGSLSIIDADVAIEYPGCPDIAEFIEEAKKNIEEEKAVVVEHSKYAPGREWNTQKCCWEETDGPAQSDIPIVINASKDDLGVPDFDPKQRNKNYKGWDYYNGYDYNDSICY